MPPTRPPDRPPLLRLSRNADATDRITDASRRSVASLARGEATPRELRLSAGALAYDRLGGPDVEASPPNRPLRAQIAAVGPTTSSRRSCRRSRRCARRGGTP